MRDVSKSSLLIILSTRSKITPIGMAKKPEGLYALNQIHKSVQIDV